MVGRNLATSSGYMGQAALDRSTRVDRSRDPLYNQSKMYSELYRMLGWLHPQPENRLLFSFTLLGAHVTAAHRDPKSFFEECLLGIAYPNPVVEARNDFRLRPFACILRTMLEMEGVLSRDEMIVGPLCLEDDRDKAIYNGMIALLRRIRGKANRLASAIDDVSGRRGISTVTMGNYTRFPLAALSWTGWTTKDRLRVYGRPVVFHVLTDEGKRLARRVSDSVDLRAADIAKLRPEIREALIKLGFYGMLERAGFDVGPLVTELQRHKATVSKQFAVLNSAGPPPLLFSPFQEILYTELQPLLPSGLGTAATSVSGKTLTTRAGAVAPAQVPAVAANVQLATQGGTGNADWNKPEVQRLVSEFQAVSTRCAGDISKVVDYFMEKHRDATKTEFYPLVANLFCILGFSCEASRVGVNYQRADAFITHTTKSIPIEIKSPTEERNISIKGVRQALENKIILLSRKSAPTTPQTSSFVVGYFPPNKRAEVAALISDIHNAYHICVGVIDFRSLTTLAAIAVLQKKFPKKSQLEELCGLINVPNT